MGEKLFDDLARALVEPMPRRRAVRLMGAILVGTSVASRPRVAWAGTTRSTTCAPKERRCQKGADGDYEEYCCGPNGNFMWCGGSDNGYRCIDKCKLAGREAGTGQWSRCGEELCCRPSDRCKKGQCVYCPSRIGCDNRCCDKGERCETCFKHELWEAPDVENGRRTCCPKGKSCCGNTCVPDSRGVFCCNGKLCPKSKPFCAHTRSAHFCCSRGQFVHETGECCPAGTVATPGGDCCPPGQRTC